MKRMKKIASMLLAVIMVLGMSLTTFAAGTDPAPEVVPKDTGNFKITLTGVETDKHSFAAYQIFKGDLKEEGGPVLSNIEWGSSVKTDASSLTALQEALKGITLKTGVKVDGSETATIEPFSTLNYTFVGEKVDLQAVSKEFAAKVAQILNGANSEDGTNKDATKNAEFAIAFADVMGSTDANGLRFLNPDSPAGTATSGTKAADEKYTYEITGLNAGYYLVQDTTGTLTGGDAYTRNILQVVSDVTAVVKTETPTIEKKILEGDKEVDYNNAGVGKVVSYQITGTVPDTTGYDYYFYVINDQLSNGLTLNYKRDVDGNLTSVPDMTVTVDGDVVYPTPDGEEDTVTVYTGTAAAYKGRNYSFRVAFNDIKADFGDASANNKAGKEIVVTYSATVNSNAVTTNAGNPNDVNLTYSNNPNHDYDGDHTNDRPGLPKDDTTVPTGETPDDRTITYVAEIKIHKVDSENNPLAGVMFTLTGTSQHTVLNTATHFEIDPNGEYWLLKDGTYTKTAPQTLPTMVASTTSAGYIELPANETAGKDAIVIGTGADAKTYRPYKEGDEGTIYTLMSPNDNLYVSAAVKYSPVTTTSADKELPTDINMVGITDADGNLTFGGLGAGTYTIIETSVLPGYNKAEDIENITITFTVKTNDNGDVTGVEWGKGQNFPASVVFGGDPEPATSDTGVYNATIVNYAGALLPSTGGIGTTIFYVAGSILVLAAVVLLVAKKRMNSEK